jgi:hypothetical protein
MVWLRKQNPEICWNTGIWHCRTCTNTEDRPIRLVSTSVFVATMGAERTQAYDLHMTDFLPEISRPLASDILMATGPERTVPDGCRVYSRVFS